MATIIVKCRNNADARRMGAGQIKVPGASAVKHTGAKNVKIESSAVDTTKLWLDAAYEVDSYEVNPVTGSTDFREKYNV
jgi:hypothetical protein